MKPQLNPITKYSHDDFKACKKHIGPWFKEGSQVGIRVGNAWHPIKSPKQYYQFKYDIKLSDQEFGLMRVMLRRERRYFVRLKMRGAA